MFLVVCEARDEVVLERRMGSKKHILELDHRLKFVRGQGTMPA
jgi:hypothetical protein